MLAPAELQSVFGRRQPFGRPLQKIDPIFLDFGKEVRSMSERRGWAAQWPSKTRRMAFRSSAARRQREQIAAEPCHGPTETSMFF